MTYTYGIRLVHIRACHTVRHITMCMYVRVLVLYMHIQEHGSCLHALPSGKCGVAMMQDEACALHGSGLPLAWGGLPVELPIELVARGLLPEELPIELNARGLLPVALLDVLARRSDTTEPVALARRLFDGEDACSGVSAAATTES